MKDQRTPAALLGASSSSRRLRQERAQRRLTAARNASYDPVLLAFLSRARSAHHSPSSEAAGTWRRPCAICQQLTQSPSHPERARGRHGAGDTHARSADLMSRAGRFDQSDAELGAAWKTPSRSYFRGHLFEVRGARRRTARKALRSKGRGQEADQARDRSLDAYDGSQKTPG